MNKAEDILNKVMSRDVDNTEILVTLAMAKSAGAKFNEVNTHMTLQLLPQNIFFQ